MENDHLTHTLEEDPPPYRFTILMGIFVLIILPNLRYLISHPSYHEDTALMQEGLEEKEQ